MKKFNLIPCESGLSRLLGRHLKMLVAAVVSSLLLSGCGGSSSGLGYGGSQNDKSPPVAVALAAGLGESTSSSEAIFNARANTQVLLTGKDSDSDVAPLFEFTWTQIDNSGYPVELIERTTNAVVFDTPNVAQKTRLQFQLLVKDANGNTDSDTVSIDVLPADDANHFLSAPGVAASQLKIIAALQEGTTTGTSERLFTVEAVSVAHWRNRNGDMDQLEVHRQVINAQFPANFSAAQGYDPLAEARNPLLIVDLHPVDLDEINHNFETQDRDRRLDAYQANTAYVETELVVNNSSGASFELIALDNSGQQIDFSLLDSSDTSVLKTMIDAANGVRADAPIAAKKLIAPSAGVVASAKSSLLQTWMNESSVTLSNTKVLDALGLENDITANNYYALIDPEGGAATLRQWLVQAGFNDSDNKPVANLDEAHALYLNNYDLGFARDMHLRIAENGNVYSYVTNYPSLEAALQRRGEFAVVAMEYSENPNPDAADNAKKIVKFYAFVKDDRTGDFVRATSMNFDGRGQKFLPGVCTACHQSDPGSRKFTNLADADLKATFIPWDMDSFLFVKANDSRLVEPTLNTSSVKAADLDTYSKENQEAQIRKLNLGALATYTGDPVRHAAPTQLVHGWYGDGDLALPIDQLPDQAFNGDYIQPGWVGQEDLYFGVYARNCRICHTQMLDTSIDSSAPRNFDSYDKLISSARLVNYVYEQGMMPLARMSMDRFWTSFYNEKSSAELLREHIQVAKPALTVPAVVGEPVVNIGVSAAEPVYGERVLVDASGSYFAETLSWRLIVPNGSASVLSSTDGLTSSFVVDKVDADYYVVVTATNEHGVSTVKTKTIHSINREPIAECLSVDAGLLDQSGRLTIPVVASLDATSLGDGGLRVQLVDNGTFGTATVDTGGESLTYQLSDALSRGQDTIHYKLVDRDGSVSMTHAKCAESDMSDYGTITIDASEFIPVSVSAVRDSTNNSSRINLSWQAPMIGSPNGYRVYRDNIAIANQVTTLFSDLGLMENTTYSYRVAAVNTTAGGDTLDFSAAANARTASLLPSAFSAQALSTSTTELALAWTVPEANLARYKLLRSVPPATAPTDEVTAPTVGAQSFVAAGLIPGTEYTFALSGVDSTAQESAPVMASAIVTPVPPANLDLELGSDVLTTINLYWPAAAGGVDQYLIYRSDDDGATFQQIASVDSSVRHYMSTGLSAGTTYSFQVVSQAGEAQAANAVESEPITSSELATAIGEQALNVRATLDSQDDASRIVVTWDKAVFEDSATTYEILRSSTDVNGDYVGDEGTYVSIGSGQLAAGTNQYADEGLTAGTFYAYLVRTTIGGETYDSDLTAAAKTFTGSLVPELDPAQISDSDITLSWASPSARVDSYAIYRSDNNYASPVATVSGAQTSYVDTPPAGNVYVYKITAIQATTNSTTPSTQESAFSNSVVALTQPEAPANVALVGSPTTTQITLSFTENGADRYRVYAKGTGEANYTLRATSTTSPITATGLSTGVDYSLVVRAITDVVIPGDASSVENISNDSAVISTTTKPLAPTNVAANLSGSQIVLSWTKATGDIDNYKVDRYNSSSVYINTVTVSGSATGYTDTAVTSGKRYRYKVKAVAGGFESVESSEVTAATTPAAPTSLSASLSNNAAQVDRVTLSWAAVAGDSVTYSVTVYSGTRTAFSRTAYNDNASDIVTLNTTANRVGNVISAGSATSLVISGLSSNSSYTFRVTATANSLTSSNASVSKTTGVSYSTDIETYNLDGRGCNDCHNYAAKPDTLRIRFTNTCVTSADIGSCSTGSVAPLTSSTLMDSVLDMTTNEKTMINRWRTTSPQYD